MTLSPLDGLQLSVLSTEEEPFYRLWKHPGADWNPSPTPGTGRVDCPVQPIEYSVLYFATTPLLALQETRLLTEDPERGTWIFHRGRAEAYKITEYRVKNSLTAVSLDEPNAQILGLDKASLIDGRRPYQDAALAILRARRSDVHALSWKSKHREANGRVVAIFDNCKSVIGLTRIGTERLLDHVVVTDISRLKALTIK